MCKWCLPYFLFYCNRKQEHIHTHLLWHDKSYLNVNFNFVFTDEWGAGDGVEVVAGVTEGSMGDTLEALTHQTAVLQGCLHPSPSAAGTGIHWELWPAVTMVSDSSDMYRTVFKQVCEPLPDGSTTLIMTDMFCNMFLMCFQILTERTQLLSPRLVAWLWLLNTWAQLWARCWPIMAPWVRVEVMKSQKVSLLPSSTCYRTYGSSGNPSGLSHVDLQAQPLSWVSLKQHIHNILAKNINWLDKERNLKE